MKNIKNMRQFNTVILLLIVILATSCKRDNNSTGHAFMPDMYYSNAYETYSSSPNFSDSFRMLEPVKGTVPRNMIPYSYEKTFDDQQRAGRELVNPVELSKSELQRGKEQYDIYCAMCHGERGKADGHLYTSKLFPVQPTSLRGDYVLNKPDGEIFHVITMGSISGLMGAHGSLVKPDDRWRIVSYIRNGFVVK